MNSISSGKSMVCCMSSEAARSRSSDVFSGSVLSFTIIVERSVGAGADAAIDFDVVAVVDVERSASVT